LSLLAAVVVHLRNLAAAAVVGIVHRCQVSHPVAGQVQKPHFLWLSVRHTLLALVLVVQVLLQ
jgi:hypothetical protein